MRRVGVSAGRRGGGEAGRRRGGEAERRVGLVFSGEAAIQDSPGRSPRNCNKTGDQR